MHYYDIYPQIVPADCVSEIRIHPRFKHAAFHQGSPWCHELRIAPACGVTEEGILPAYVWGSKDGVPAEWKVDENGDLVVSNLILNHSCLASTERMCPPKSLLSLIKCRWNPDTQGPSKALGVQNPTTSPLTFSNSHTFCSSTASFMGPHGFSLLETVRVTTFLNSPEHFSAQG